MRVTFFLEPFPLRQDPYQLTYPANHWAPMVSELERLGSRVSFICSDLLGHHRFKGSEWFSPGSLGFQIPAAQSAVESDRQWVELMRNPDEPVWKPVVSALLDRAAPD